jgi:hypothetical protein
MDPFPAFSFYVFSLSADTPPLYICSYTSPVLSSTHIPLLFLSFTLDLPSFLTTHIAPFSSRRSLIDLIVLSLFVLFPSQDFSNAYLVRRSRLSPSQRKRKGEHRERMKRRSLVEHYIRRLSTSAHCQLSVLSS